MNKFFVVINNAKRDSWSDWVWRDIQNQANIYLDNNVLKNKLLRKLKEFHFANKINTYVHLPLKEIWNNTLCIKIKTLDEIDRNYIIFQNSIKFAPSYLKKIKDTKNACIVLYLYDTAEQLGLGKNIKEFKKYCDYYHIDEVFSFDQKDVDRLKLNYFDLYSSLNVNFPEIDSTQTGIFYIGSCRSKNRLDSLHSLFKKCLQNIVCNFYIVGVEEKDKEFPREIHYNQELTYSTVLKEINTCDCILEINNLDQRGYTIRFKEAVCHNKRLLTNNYEVKKSPYYNPDFIYIYTQPEDIDINWLKSQKTINYGYKDEFSPVTLVKKVVYLDETKSYWLGGN